MRWFTIALCFMLPTFSHARAQDVSCVPNTSRPVLRPIMATHTLPPYPALSTKLEEEGTTLLRVAIGLDGTPTEVIVDNSSGSVRLDSAAAAYVKTVWRWQPTLGPDCTPMKIVTRVSINWALRDRPSPDAVRYTQLNMAQADYPPGAMERKEQGFVTVAITVPPDGATPGFAVSSTSGYPDLDDKALDILKTRYRWKAGEMNGKPVLTTLGIIAIWTLPLPAKE
ncbi:MAG TPA: energy transducer TonB [Rhizomicrobium sp.]|nr:energy transducer TonB [Rhizomicrobium sp.]